MKKGIKILAGVLGIFLILMVVLFFKMGSDMKNLRVDEVDLHSVQDGVYIGKSETTLVKVEVKVEVKDHKIIRIDILKHEHGKGEKAERITDDMIRENKIDVDAISGATTSSEVIKSAVSDALTNGWVQ
ncbi:MAG TPA: hypothetical protein DDZ89_02500 [Clostridiales bacterium]|nr:hypothetical protein [Clostridiales bacterium]